MPVVRKLQALDERVLRVVVERRNERLDRPVAGLSNLSRGAIVWLAAFAVARLKARDRVPAFRRGAFAIIAPYALSVLLARGVSRSRPCRTGTVALVDCPSGPSLPSDQAAGAFAGAAVLAGAFPKLRLAFLFVAAVSASARVYAGVHYPTDVAAGAALGAAIARLAA
jgi:membrane-associated phospholipid phosphatase